MPSPRIHCAGLCFLHKTPFSLRPQGSLGREADAFYHPAWGQAAGKGVSKEGSPGPSVTVRCPKLHLFAQQEPRCHHRGRRQLGVAAAIAANTSTPGWFDQVRIGEAVAPVPVIAGFHLGSDLWGLLGETGSRSGYSHSGLDFKEENATLQKLVWYRV